MFKQFWKKKKDLIEAIGIITAVGAIFLAIPKPENELAQTALYNIQMIWLIIVSLAIILLFLNFLSLALRIEQEAEKKINYDFGGAFSILIFWLLFWLMKNLWAYMLALYKKELLDFMPLINQTIIGIIFAISFYFEKHLTNLYTKKELVNFYLILLGISTSSGILYSLWCQLSKLHFIWKSFLTDSLIFGAMIFLLNMIFIILRFRKANKSESS
jgi:hypothetical protein